MPKVLHPITEQITLPRDGVLYFVTIMSTRVANVFMFARGNVRV